MKKFILFILCGVALLSFKDKPIKVDPANMGKYYASDTAPKPTWILKINPNEDNKVEFYQPGDNTPIFMAAMKDSTHFKTQHEFAHTSNQVTKMWSAKGAFIGNNQIELVVHTSDVTTGLKLTFSFDEDQKIVYTKR